MLNRLISLVFLLTFLNINVVYSENNFLLPQKKPSIFKKSEKQINEVISKNLPIPKPRIENKNNEKNAQKIEKTTVEKQVTKSTEKIISSAFVFPKKKPITYKVSSKEVTSSKVLNKKDFEKAKETIKFIKEKKWNSALKSAQKVKDSEFRKLISWMHLKTTRNGASFNEYKKFIEQNDYYPRINRIRYLAEEKIYLRNNSPTSIINWFEKYPPLGGLGKIKLAEAYLEQGKIDEVKKLVKDGWRTAEIRKNDLGYYRAKFKKFLKVDG